MNVIWTPRASDDLQNAVDFIARDSPDAALKVSARIYDQIVKLGTMPNMGRIGRVRGTRELVFHPWPYIAVYIVQDDELQIIRIRHASQQWP